MPATLNDAKSGVRELTGRQVLWMLLGFFGVVFAANAIMARVAIQTFRGLANDHAYTEGLDYNHQIQSAHDQDALGWAVNGALTRIAPGRTRITVTQMNAQREASENVTVDLAFEHPADRERDKVLTLVKTAPGHYSGEVEIEPGQWGLTLRVSQNGKPVFQSLNRVDISDRNP